MPVGPEDLIVMGIDREIAPFAGAANGEAGGDSLRGGGQGESKREPEAIEPGTEIGRGSRDDGSPSSDLPA